MRKITDVNTNFISLRHCFRPSVDMEDLFGEDVAAKEDGSPMTTSSRSGLNLEARLRLLKQRHVSLLKLAQLSQANLRKTCISASATQIGVAMDVAYQQRKRLNVFAARKLQLQMLNGANRRV